MTTATDDGPDTTSPELGRMDVSDDPRYSNPVDALEFDSVDSEIDFEEIYQSTQPDFEAGRYSFNSADYATHEEAMVAMDALIHSIAEEVERDITSNSSLDAPS
jgi:hypothetical protein